MSKSKAYLFGLNYAHNPSAALTGCINDVNNVANFLRTDLRIPVEVYTDDRSAPETTCKGMMDKLYEIAFSTWRDNLDFVWIHYSGHGSYVRDTNGDEVDGRDECIIPTDFATNGVITDDAIQRIFTFFNPNTRIMCFFDCCHSGTMGDVKFSWNGPARCFWENPQCKTNARVLTISGCLDNQVSYETYSQTSRQVVGVMTDALLRVLRTKPNVRRDVFLMISELQKEIIKMGYPQRPKLCTSYYANKDRLYLSKL